MKFWLIFSKLRSVWNLAKYRVRKICVERQCCISFPNSSRCWMVWVPWKSASELLLLHTFDLLNIKQVLVATPHKAAVYGHPPPITKTIKVKRTRHAGHCWRNRDVLISDILIWTPSHGREKAGRPTRTYIQQLGEDTGCSPEDLPEAINDREGWRGSFRDIRADGTTRWGWLWWLARPAAEMSAPTKKGCACMISNCIWMWSYSSEAQVFVEQLKPHNFV